MSSKANTPCKTVATRSEKNTVESKQHLPSHEVPTEGIILYDDCNTLIEVTVKANGRKRTSTMVSSSPTSHKAVEEKRRPSSSGDSHQGWCQILREQNRATVKQSLQQLAGRIPAAKPLKHATETKEMKKNSKSHQRHENKHLDEIPVKQSASQKRIEEQIKVTPCTTNPSTTSVPSSVDSILVVDRGVQCGGIFDCSDDRFGACNPVRTLGFLMKELEHLIKDDKASKIFTDMEQALLRIPAESGKTSFVDIEAMTLRTRLEATTIQLEETSKKMNTMCETLREERDCFQRQVHKQAVMLNEARERQLDLETTIKTLKQEVQEAMKTTHAKDKIITELKEEIRGHEFCQKVITDLRTNLAEQIELARQRHLEVQYLTLEKDKLTVLCSYKDSLLNELRNAIKELQNQITDQLSNLNMYVHEESINPQGSLVHGGLACSSPTSTSSRESNIPTSWHDISDVSLSTVDHIPSKNRDVNKFLHKPDKPSASTENHFGNFEKNETKRIKEPQTKDSANLEFISLPGGESSLMLLSSYKDLGCTEISQSGHKGNEDVTTHNNKKTDNLRNSKSVDKMSLSECLNSPSEKTREKEARVNDTPKNRKSSGLHKKQSYEKKSTLIDDSSNILENNLPQNLLRTAISEQFQNMFHDIRTQSRMPVNIPSPPRNYPHPNWIDNTLSSISAASELTL
ncbi:uncharacterized protein LOC128877334 [Hylaeus volcanicus]|uniref:uncharacterized protein LOC128877334 n=1 Tax=Hylaeus volcanicus TaxID=313075 RepID=UPI0023B85AB3|nr:uncharacterized protein LOC128877334 [Hylaeus volcanicus]XP_053980531.1 uncharacterized protein LOC128877334 [Hylaeus volcanicus]XP_053980532.1 uncharacterized protein LOC128877334 [Hylaeus volcanicus]XP_053980533.1 uncharacterized protein LOC128877334 [Hylaeus volcanicus]XP_053980534.1 uncharacterized protein LOC128877334 [Hylaeus volcanicus]XP_053980535.1 uncharacterized protein LOC128877334 [Hylaeus volcanicus]XP_053980536.1 uncharacterized protein LOC128877334 [Hylaeus volcanicus]